MDAGIVVVHGQFDDRAQVVADIVAAGHSFVELDITAEQLNATPHAHPDATDIYLIAGALELREPGTGRTYHPTAGSRISVPAHTLHSEHSDGPLRIIIGRPSRS